MLGKDFLRRIPRLLMRSRQLSGCALFATGEATRPAEVVVGDHPALDRILTHALTGQLRQPIEPAPHVHRRRAHEDAHTRRDHRAVSSTRSRRASASASKCAGTPTLRPSPSPTSNRSSAGARADRTSTIFASAGPVSSAATLLSSRRHRLNVSGPTPICRANSLALLSLASHRAATSGHPSRYRLIAHANYARGPHLSAT